MIERIKRWLHDRRSSDESPAARRSPRTSPNRKTPNRQLAKPGVPKLSPDRRKSSPNSANDVRIRKKFIREDTGTHETLTILDDSLINADDETGIDPYNTGAFDRSKNWDSRFRK